MEQKTTVPQMKPGSLFLHQKMVSIEPFPRLYTLTTDARWASVCGECIQPDFFSHSSADFWLTNIRILTDKQM
jgi:hypothetical protein